ncbi:MAG: hypothetical protein JXB62_21150 [Pirellulales bacterium]|nr:hypothetical protein [Pirellulales bacterium]
MQRYLTARTVILCAAVLTAFAAAARAGETRSNGTEKENRFLRLVRGDDQRPVALQAAIVRCTSAEDGKKGLTVDLVAAVHVAERSYYQTLNREFAKHDAVLYELVAPQGTRVPRGGAHSGGSPVSLLQHGMKNVLELQFQLEEIDYTRENMVHADMSPDQFTDSMRRRGESVFSMFFRMFGYALAQQSRSGGKSADGQLLVALFDKNRALALKRVMAEQFEDMDGMLLALDGPDGSTMISERNKVAIAALRKQIAVGKQNLAIFYGAGHMPDLLKRLRDDFGLVPVHTRWLTAWNLKSPQKQPSQQEQLPPEKPPADGSQDHEPLVEAGTAEK